MNKLSLKDSDILNPEVSFSNKLKLATDIANTLNDVIESQRLYTLINGKKHVRVDGWALLGTLLGCTSYVEQVVELPSDNPNEHVYEATACIRYNGEIINRASHIASTHEQTNKYGKIIPRKPFAAYSLAETRAIGKAYRLPLGFIMNLAKYESTPAEDMPTNDEPKPKGEVIIDANNDLQVDDPEPIRTIWGNLIRTCKEDDELELTNLSLKQLALKMKEDNEINIQTYREVIKFIDDHCPEDAEDENN